MLNLASGNRKSRGFSITFNDIFASEIKLIYTDSTNGAESRLYHKAYICTIFRITTTIKCKYIIIRILRHLIYMELN